MAEYPTWALELVAALEVHEGVHPRAGLPDAGDDEHVCAKAILDRVPAEVRTFAAGWAAGKRRAEQEAAKAYKPDEISV